MNGLGVWYEKRALMYSYVYIPSSQLDYDCNLTNDCQPRKFTVGLQM